VSVSQEVLTKDYSFEQIQTFSNLTILKVKFFSF
jgi:hypothetical protein